MGDGCTSLRTAGAVAGIVMLLAVGAACGSDAHVATSGGGSTTGAPPAVIGTTWTRAGDLATRKFCAVGHAIPADATATTEAPIEPGACELSIAWQNVTHFVIVDGGATTVDFVAGDDASGTCAGTAAVDGDTVHFGAPDCSPTRSGDMVFDFTALTDATGTFDGTCLEVDRVWFEATPDTCTDRVDDVPDAKFSTVPAPIERAPAD